MDRGRVDFVNFQQWRCLKRMMLAPIESEIIWDIWTSFVPAPGVLKISIFNLKTLFLGKRKLEESILPWILRFSNKKPLALIVDDT
jgi:hypothetical protein